MGNAIEVESMMEIMFGNKPPADASLSFLEAAAKVQAGADFEAATPAQREATKVVEALRQLVDDVANYKPRVDVSCV